MDRIEKTELLMNAIFRYTPDKQYQMVIEECSELIQAICKLKRAKTAGEMKDALERVMEETADVEILLEQIHMMADSKKIQDYKLAKLQRLKERMNNHGNQD